MGGREGEREWEGGRDWEREREREREIPVHIYVSCNDTLVTVC